MIPSGERIVLQELRRGDQEQLAGADALASDDRVRLEVRACERTREHRDLVALREISGREREAFRGRVGGRVVVVDALRCAAVGDDPEDRERGERGGGEDERERAPHAAPRTLSITVRARWRQSSYASIEL